MPTLPIDAITIDKACQPRATMSPEIVDDYVESMRDGAVFPPITVISDGSTNWVTDGFHRLFAAKKVGRVEIDCTVIPGDHRAAILHAVGANTTHGMRRTNLDKRNAVETLLKDDEWSQWSDSEIARRCGVHQTFVGKVRASLMTNISDESPRTYTDRHGNVTTMNTTNIGKSGATTALIERKPDEPLSDLPYDVVDPVTGEILNEDGPNPVRVVAAPRIPARRPIEPQEDIEARANIAAADLVARHGVAHAVRIARAIFRQTGGEA